MQRINAAVARFERLDPLDLEEQKDLLTELQEIRLSLSKHAYKEVVDYVDAAMLLISYLTHMGRVGGQEVTSVIRRLLEAADATHEQVEVRLEQERVEQALTVVQSEKTVCLRLIGDMLLGEILVQLGHIDQNDIHTALAEQRSTGIQFGEALVKTGSATWQQVEAGLRYQDGYRHALDDLSKRRQESAERDEPEEPAAGLRLVSDVLLGQILVDNGLITKDQLDQGLQVQRGSSMRIGDALVEIGVSWGAIKRGLEIQGELRKYA